MSKLRTTLITLIGAITLSTVSVSAMNVSNDEKYVYVKEGDETLLVMPTCGETVYTTTDVNLRTQPNFGSCIADVVPANTKLLKVGNTTKNWVMVQINGVNYFMYAEFLTTDIPAEVHEYKTAEEEPETVTAVSSNVYLGDWTITFYCNCAECCGSWSGGNTASGTVPTEGRTAACGSLDFGTQIYIDGLGTYTVEDRGVEGNWIDIYLNDHDRCNQMGMLSRGVYKVN